MNKLSNFFSKGAACALLFGGMTLASCGGSDEFTASSAEDALEDFNLLFNENAGPGTNTFNVGYYEVTPGEGNTLRQLVKAGVITCKFDVVVEEVTKYRYVGWNRETYTENKHHIFANVQLTKEGEKYVAKTDLKNEVRDDYKKVVVKIQEAMSKEVKAPEYTTLPDTIFYSEESKATEKSDDNSNFNDNNEVAGKSAYQIALSKVASTPVKVRGYKLKLKNVFDVYATEDMMKNNKGECKFTAQMTDFTPFAWVQKKNLKEEIILLKASFKKYQDKGWVVENVSDANMTTTFGVDITPLTEEE